MANDFLVRLFDALDGKAFTLDGVSGRFRFRSRRAYYPYEHTVHELVHEADEAGRESAAYRAVRAELGDDYVSDLTTSDRLVDVAIAAGVDVDAIAAAAR